MASKISINTEKKGEFSCRKEHNEKINDKNSESTLEEILTNYFIKLLTDRFVL